MTVLVDAKFGAKIARGRWLCNATLSRKKRRDKDKRSAGEELTQNAGGRVDEHIGNSECERSGRSIYKLYPSFAFRIDGLQLLFKL